MGQDGRRYDGSLQGATGLMMAKKKVWLETTHLFSAKGGSWTGIAYYTACIVRGLGRRAKYDYAAVANLFITNKNSTLELNASMPIRLWRLFPGKVWNQLIKKHLLPPLNLLFFGKPDLVVFFNFNRLPVARSVKTITFIHDLAFVHFPEHIDDKNLKFLSRFVPLAISKSSQIATISEATKQDIVETYGVDPSKVSVILGAVDHTRFKKTVLTHGVRTKYRLPSKYILSVSTIEPRKNITSLVSAYASLPTSIRKEYKLVLAGGKGWKDNKILELVGSHDLANDIIMTGYVDDEDIASLYSGAELFIFPSLYEGFGLPILEAMACGVPVISADNSSLPETGGDAARYVGAEDIEGLTEAIKEVLRNPDLRRSMSDKGIKQAARYGWEDSARAMELVIAEVLER